MAENIETVQETPTVESLMEEISKLKLENTRNKTALDKALKNNGDLTKQLRSKMTVDEQEAQARREAEEAQVQKIRELEEYQVRAEAEKRYVKMGMGAELAEKAADADVRNDKDALATLLKQFTDAKVQEAMDAWLKSRPDISAGHDDADDEMTKLEREINAAMGL